MPHKIGRPTLENIKAQADRFGLRHADLYRRVVREGQPMRKAIADLLAHKGKTLPAPPPKPYKRKHRWIEVQGKRRQLIAFAREMGVEANALEQRVLRGQDPIEAAKAMRERKVALTAKRAEKRRRAEEFLATRGA